MRIGRGLQYLSLLSDVDMANFGIDVTIDDVVFIDIDMQNSNIMS